jgi:hypothetical protein
MIAPRLVDGVISHVFTCLKPGMLEPILYSRLEQWQSVDRIILYFDPAPVPLMLKAAINRP